MKKSSKFFKPLSFITFLFLLPAIQAYAQDSYLIVHAHNPEGIEIASIEGMESNSVEIYAGDNLIGYGAYDSKTHNQPIPISPGTHTIKAKFNGMTKEEIISLEAGETKEVIFTFERTNYIDEVKNRLAMNFSDTVSVSGWTDKEGRVWKETDSYAVGGHFWAQSVSANISAAVQGIIIPLGNNRFRMEHHLLSGTAYCWNQHSSNGSWSAGVTAFVLINQKNVLSLPSTCEQWFAQGEGLTTGQGGISLQVGGLPAEDETNQEKISSDISHLGEDIYYMIRLSPGTYNIRGGFREPAGMYDRSGYGNDDPGTENTVDFNSIEDIELASSVSDVPYYFGLYIEAKTDKDSYEPDEKVKISCLVKDGETGFSISADTITAEITKPDDSKETVSLSEVATGSYEATFSNSSLLGSYHLKIEAKKEGYRDGKAELDFIVGMLEILDGVDFSAGREISDNPDKLASGGVSVRGAVTDGVTRLLLRLNVDELNEVTFSLEGTGNPEEDGVLRAIDGSQEGQSITVSTTETIKGKKAFAIYQAPENFVRAGHNEDKKVSERTISLNIKPNRSPSFEFSTEIKLVRPPVILIHGLWSGPGMWNEFINKIKNKIVGIHIFTADYKETNASHFEVNKEEIYKWISKAKDKFHSRKIAIVQADVVAHSMGGLLARIWSGAGEYVYKQNNNFWMGDINKLITLDSPHFGSFLADFAIEILDNMEEEEKNTLLELAREKDFSLDEGAVEDLMTMSPKIIKMNTVPTDSASHAIVGDVGRNLNSLKDTGTLLYIILTSIEHNTGTDILPDYSDLVVSSESQAGGLVSPKSSIFDHWHCAATTQEVANKTIELLNVEPDSASFESGFPVKQWPK